MKFVCNQCLSKYSIADEKVRGKILKIRCVKCGNLIEVRDDAAPKEPKPRSPLEERFAASFKAAPGTPSTPPRPMGTPGLRDAIQKSAKKIERDDVGLAIWFVAMDDAPSGPISARAVDERKKAGKLRDDSLVWREGMDDWIPLSTCQDLVVLLARLESEGTSAHGAHAVSKPPRLGLFAAGDRASMPPLDSPLRGRGLGASADRPEAVASMLPPQVAPPQPPVPAAAAEAAAAAAAQHAASDEEAFFSAHHLRTSIASIIPPRHSHLDKWVKLAAVGFFVVAVAVLCVILFAGKEDEKPKVVEKVVERIVEREKVVYRDREVKSDEVGVGTDADRAGKKGGRIGKAKTESEPDSAEEKKRRLLEQLGASTPGAQTSLVGGSSERNGSGSSGAVGATGQGLSDRDFSTVVGKNKGSLQICYEQSMKKGEAPSDRDLKVLVDLTVGGTGMVKRVSVGGPGAKYPGLKGCIESAAKKWLFPSSSAESTAEFPFLFTPK